MTVNSPLSDFIKFQHKLETATTVNEITMLFADYAKPMGVNYFVCAAIQGAYCTPEMSRMLGYNDSEWSRHYMANKYYLDDLVIKYGAIARKVFTYEEMINSHDMTERQKLIMREAHDFGLAEGLVVPLRSSDDHLALFSIAGRGFSNDPKCRGQLHMGAIYAHERALQVLDGAYEIGGVNITKTQHDVLSYAALGKTDGEIATILNITEGSVSKHIAAVKQKSGAHTRLQLGAILRSGRLIH
ncbi:helix-turn-helix transcriptional regulator [Kordiimonas aquimaris]|uniref:helix-turn-helix transcriptional regulator n=1 Tax=Kordiimonas aquimaris TaxID=707591 RepID=UPI0021D0955D|nr:LuxR family transcriptional regulator [Kordiimonas aquimaris]